MVSIEQYLASNPSFRKVVVGYPLKEGEVLLGLRKNSSTNLGLGLISGIGGGVEEGETEETALVREFLEETSTNSLVGLKPELFRRMGEVVFLFPHKPKWNQICGIYLIKEWFGVPQETDETKPIWYEVDKLPETQMWADNLLWVPEVLAGKQVKGTILYDENNNVIEYELDPGSSPG